MKPIFIERGSTKKKKKPWMIVLLGLMVVFLVMARIVAPYALESYINNKGADEKGYAFRIGDVDLKLLKGEVYLKDLKVFNARSAMNFLEVPVLSMNFNWIELFNKERTFHVRGDELNFTLSKDLFEEIKRIKNEAKARTGLDIYLDHVAAFFEKINVREVEKDSVRTILSLVDSKIDLTDVGVGSINEKTEFKVNSGIMEGGTIALNGKTKLEAPNTPWSIEGNLTGIKPDVINKLAGDKLPLEIKEAHINADITAASSGGQIEGILTPNIKEFRLSEDKEEGPIKKTIGKAANVLFDKTQGDDDAMKLEIPFTLKENFTLNIQDTIDKLIKQKK